MTVDLPKPAPIPPGPNSPSVPAREECNGPGRMCAMEEHKLTGSVIVSGENDPVTFWY